MPYARFLICIIMNESIFTDVIDDLVVMSENDPELAAGIRWIDENAQKRGVSFYDVAFEVLYQYGKIQSPSVWFESRN